MIFSIISILNIFLIGFFIFSFVGRKKAFLCFPLKIIYSFVVGAGLTTFSYLLFLIVFGKYSILYFYLESLFSLICAFFIVLEIRKTHIPLYKHDSRTIVFSLLTLIVSIFLIIFCFYHPHGEGDSITIWNLRARFLFFGGDNWRNAFSRTLEFSHPNYPPFLPLLISRFWSISQEDSLFFPVGIALFSTIASPILLFFSLRIFSDESKASIASFILLGTSSFLTHGASQFADIPMGLLLLLIFVLARFYDSRNTRILFVLGFLSALCAFTKNEGIAMFLLFSIVFLFKKTRKEIITYFLGTLPVLIAILYFKIFLAPPDDIFVKQNLSVVLKKIVDIQRHKEIVIYFAKNIFFFGNWKINPFIILTPFLLLQIKNIKKLNVFQLKGLSLLLLILASEYFIYLISPYDLRWHLKFSFNRLLLQIWPSFLFLSFLV